MYLVDHRQELASWLKQDRVVLLEIVGRKREVAMELGE